jgi:iron-sulfur cluster assembly protein
MVETINAEDLIEINTGVVGAQGDDFFKVSKKALQTITSIRQTNQVPEDFFVRIGTRSGGCSGMSYLLGFDQDMNENDRLLEHNGAKFLVDDVSLFYLMGITLDYVDDAMGSGFVFDNPYSSHTCGCHA